MHKQIYFTIAAVFAAQSAVMLVPPSNAAEPAPAKNVRPQKPEYSITDLGEIPAVAGDLCPSINNQGHVSFWTKDDDGQMHAVLWSGGQTTTLPKLAGYLGSVCRSINDNDDVAGWTTTSRNMVDSSATVHPVLFRKGVAIDLGTLGGQDAQANFVSNAGDVVGVSLLGDRKTRHAFLWQNGKMKDLGALPDGSFSAAYSINETGDVVGVADKGGQNHAVKWHNGVIQDLGTIEKQPRSFATSINKSGVIVGFGETDDGVHALKFGKTDIDDLGVLGGDPSNARAINDAGTIVGMSGFNGHDLHAFIYRSGAMTDLNLLIPADTTWRLREADDINNRGEIICIGNHRHEPLHCLLLTPL